MKNALIFSLLLSCLWWAARASERIATDTIDGTYTFEMCRESCSSTKENDKVFGTVVIDESRRKFNADNEAMKFLIRGDIGTLDADYCYCFPSDGPGEHGTLLQSDNVGFGNLIKGQGGSITISFLNDSPDFKFLSRITRFGLDFIGNWSHGFGGHPTIYFPGAELVLKKTGPADTAICFDAVRKYERTQLKGHCSEFHAKTCEPGDKVP